ncbi:hypothetical protein [Prosthecobacter vanneervenii]|uniref:Uncharacterized protein n=1 Tax=Prosthecobacter vanneervenii TaxID=48466 RepID=A0A7W7YCX3_9BACT|nr:hypothetical protein [Prosthecobacter vanneervenii]MBB5033789.1 hypothetical protein [Prosthecobacter vanneervenii]
MDKEHTSTLREWFLEQLLHEQLQSSTPLSGEMDGLKNSLRKLAADYAVLVQISRQQTSRLAGRPLVLLISPRRPANTAFLLRLSGVLASAEDSDEGLHFKPLTVEMRSGGDSVLKKDGTPDEENTQVLVDHLRRVLEALSPARAESLALSA